MRFYAWDYDASQLEVRIPGSILSLQIDRSQSRDGFLENLTTGSEGLPQLLHGLHDLYHSAFLRRGSSVELTLK